jgi:hypothetical protein
LSEKIVTDSKGRKLAVEKLDLVREMDLAEAAGDAGDVRRWWVYATICATVRSIDGVPVMMPKDKEGIKNLVRQVGEAGVAAALEALGDEVPDAAVAEVNEAAAKN